MKWNEMLLGMGGPRAGQADPWAAFAAMASGQQAPTESAAEETPLVRALSRIQKERERLGPAPTMDPTTQSDMQAGERQRELANALLGNEYVPNSGALGALAQTFSAYKGGKLDRQAGETMADALRRETEQRNAAAQWEGKRKEFEDAYGRLEAMGKRSELTGYEPSPQEMVAGEVTRPERRPTSAMEYEMANEDPGYAAFLEARRPKGTNVTVQMPAGQRAFDVELGKTDAKTYAGWRENAVQASRTLQQVGAVEQILSLQKTGKMEEAMAVAGQYFGTEAGANLQALKAAIQPIVLAQVRQLGSGNGITDSDRKFIEAGMPGFGNEPSANERAMRIMRNSAQANVRLYQEADDYLQKNESLRGFNPTVAPAPAGGGGGEPARPAPAASGTRLRYNPETGEIE